MEIPATVELIKDVVSDKLGREAIVRKINNREQYFILDLAFSYFQKADRNKRNDYRSGYLYLQSKGINSLLFVIAHSPIMIDFFSKNFDYQRFREILINTSQYRNENSIRYAQSATNKTIERTESLEDFLALLDALQKNDFKKQVFTKPTAKDPKSGNIFVVRIANDFKDDEIFDIIDNSWDLFMWLYPTKPVFNRMASLNRSMLRIPKRCEIDQIINIPDDIRAKTCSGQIEGAHIVPHKDGGSDKLDNGVWLCSTHHRLTEGKLEGSRDLNGISVKFKRRI